ncbi:MULTISPECIES: hypothetical protein [Pseudomonas]|uniref:hypothetical protein n=1 Tax=Pseudomonas TaxID=286 RepID=UPI002169BB2F|nr:hypothetical protein [Pseudomonas grimontii]MCS3513332.1 hypothetical protein [Pseudomonas grimontii]
MQEETMIELDINELEEIRGGGAFQDAGKWVDGATQTVEDWFGGVGKAITNS